MTIWNICFEVWSTFPYLESDNIRWQRFETVVLGIVEALGTLRNVLFSYLFMVASLAYRSIDASVKASISVLIPSFLPPNQSSLQGNLNRTRDSFTCSRSNNRDTLVELMTTP